jgi:hypothetical protein
MAQTMYTHMNKQINNFKKETGLGVVMHAYNPSTHKADEEGSQV